MKKLTVVILFVLTALVTSAAPVWNMPTIRLQPNGDTLHVFVTGDEFFQRLHDADGYTIVQNVETGDYVYATLAANGTLVPTSLMACKANPAEAGLQPGLMPSSQVLRQMHESWEIPEKYRQPESKRQSWAFTHLNNIVIFIRFSDETVLSTSPFSTFNQMFNDSTAGTISMYSYFRRASYNNLILPTYFFPAPSGSTVLSYQDSHPRSYYQPYNATTNTNGYNGDTARRNREFTLLQNAVNWINTNSPVPTNINLDYDNDGNIDNICFVVSGTYTDWSGLLWPHKWSLYDRTVYINNKRVYTFNLQLAGSGDHYFSVGTFCHEMTHTLGAPDLYHYNYYTSVSPAGAWDLMASNGSNPQSTNSLFRLKYTGWLDSIPLLSDSGTYTMYSLASGPNNAYKIASADPHQWYILEYRNNTDTCDQTIPGRGMLVWRYKDNAPSNANFDNSANQHELWLFRPNSTSDTVQGTISQAAFGLYGRSTFNATSNPHPYLCDGSVDTSFTLTNIQVSANHEYVTFTFNPNANMPCAGPQPLPMFQGFEDGSEGCWMTACATSTNLSRLGVITSQGTVGPRTGNYMFRFSSTNSSTDYSQYLISPQLRSTSSDTARHISFYARRSSVLYTEQYKIRYSTTTRDTSAFTNQVASVTVNYNNWRLVDYQIPAEAKYIAIQYYSTRNRANLLIDDIQIRDTLIAIHDTTYIQVHDTLVRTDYDTVYYTQQDTLFYTPTDTLVRWMVDTQIFIPSRYSVVVVSNATGRGKVSGSGVFPEGAEVEIAAMSKTHYHFSRWQDNNTDNPRRITVNSNMALTAYFEPDGNNTPEKLVIVHDTIYVHDTVWVVLHDTVHYTLHDTVWLPTDRHDTLWVDMDSVFYLDTTTMYTITVLSSNPQGGVAAGNGTFPVGTEVSLGAVAADGYTFSHWSDNSTDLPYVVTLNSDLMLTAYFTNGNTEAIGGNSGSVWMVYAVGSHAIVTGAQGHRVAVYNVLGQQVYSSPGTVQTAQLSIPLGQGLFMVKIDDYPAVKVKTTQQ